MIHVTIRKLRAGLAGASGLVPGLALLGATDAGCAAPASTTEALGHTASASTSTSVVDPGSGTLSLAPRYAGDGRIHFTFDVANTTDEFVRVGESIAFDAQAYYLWTALHPDGTPLPTDVATVEALSVTYEVQFLSKGDVVSHATLGVTSWSGDAPWDLRAQTGTVTIPPFTDTIEVGLLIADTTGAHVELSDLDFDTVPVFGGELPLKHVLFDNDGSTLRQRVIEGGGLVPGGSAILTYSDWRADEVVDKLMIDREIGTAQSYSRFGPIVTPIYGDIAYEVSFGWSFDGTSWAETSLPATTTSRVIDLLGRTAYEGTIYYVPTSGSSDLKLYFHVKAFLVVDYTRYGQSVLTKKYNQGDRLLVRERWDNPSGAYSNYDVPVETSQAAP
jgi:hypothetical protein